MMQSKSIQHWSFRYIDEKVPCNQPVFMHSSKSRWYLYAYLNTCVHNRQFPLPTKFKSRQRDANKSSLLEIKEHTKMWQQFPPAIQKYTKFAIFAKLYFSHLQHFATKLRNFTHFRIRPWASSFPWPYGRARASQVLGYTENPEVQENLQQFLKRMFLNWDASTPVTIFKDKYYEETKYLC